MAATTNTKVNLEYGFTVTTYKDDTLFITTKNADGENIEFDGIKGNLMDASGFEAHYTDEDIEYTVAEYKEGSLSFLTDWGVDAEVAKAIVKELTSWFSRYAIAEPTADTWLKVLEKRVKDLAFKEQMYKQEIDKAVKSFRDWVSTAPDIDIVYDSESKANSIKKTKEEYTAVWHELRKAKAELANYKETMHIG